MTPLIILITLASYLAVLTLLSYLSSRRAKSADYFVAGRSTRWYSAAAAMITAAMSGITFVSVPGAVAADGFSYMQMVAGFTVGQLIIAFVLIPMFYKAGVVSLYQYLDQRFGVSSHKSGAWLFFLSKLMIVALRLYVMCTVMQLLLFDHYGIPFWVNTSLTVAFVWFASRKGGVKSLIWTDTLKSICLVGSVVLTIALICSELGWSVQDMVAQIDGSEYSKWLYLDDASSPRYFWKMFLAGAFTLVAMTGLDQDMMQCNLSCVNYRQSQVNIVITAVCQIFVILLLLVLGALLYLFVQSRGLELPAQADQVFSFVAFEGGLHPLVGVLFILGLSASTYASAASSLTALTTSFTVDIVGVDTTADEDHVSRVRRRGHSLLAVAIAVLILFVGGLGSQSVINTLYKFVGYTYGPILGLFAVGLLSKVAVRDRAIPFVVVASLVLTIALEWACKQYLGYTFGFELLIVNALITVAGMLLVAKK